MAARGEKPEDEAMAREEIEEEIEARWVTPRSVWERYGAERMRALGEAPSVYSFRQPPLDAGSAVDLLPIAPGASVLDAGCGPGAYLPHLARRVGPTGRLVGLDFSPLMLRESAKHGVAALLAGDVQRLPFADTRFDLVLSAHMLYHVPDIRAALREFRRVLRPAGALAIVVGTERDQAALGDLFVAAGGAFPLARYDERFTADNVPGYLDGIFEHIERTVATPELVITDAAVLVAHFRGERAIAEPALRPGVSWASFLAAVERIASETIAREGAFRVPEEIALLLCRGET